MNQPLGYANIIKLNRHELGFLTGETDPEVGTARLWQDQFRLIIVTMDKTGCFYRTRDTHGFVPSRPVTAVDTVGAGDGFMAGILDGLRRTDFSFTENDVQAACRQAVAVGALTVSKPGGIPAMPYRQEVDAFGF